MSAGFLFFVAGVLNCLVSFLVARAGSKTEGFIWKYDGVIAWAIVAILGLFGDFK